MKPIESTYEILAWKHFNLPVDEKWINWAVEMLIEGFETEHLIELAGILKPYNQHELCYLTDKVFKELNLDYSNQNNVLTNYITFLGKQVLKGERDLLKSLSVLKDIHIGNDYLEITQDFCSLYWAKLDLEFSEVQWYWPDADRSNIDQICIQHFEDWINENEDKYNYL